MCLRLLSRDILLLAATLFVTSGAVAAPQKKVAPLPEAYIESPAYVQPVTAQLVLPALATSTRAVKVLLVTVVPASSACYQPDADVAHLDRFNHVISARARAFLDDAGCAKRRSRYDIQTLELGLLAPGTHTIRVEDTVTPVPPATLVVADGAIAQNH